MLSMNSRWTILIGLVIFVGVVICLFVAVLIFSPGSPSFLSNLLAPEKLGMRIFVQSPPVVSPDKEFKMTVTVQNLGENYLQIDEIRLPQELIDAAIVMAVIPGTINQTTYEDSTGFQIGFVMAPAATQVFEITLKPLKEVDVMGDVQVLSGSEQARSGIRLVIARALAEAPTATATVTPTVTPSVTPSPIPPTATPVAVPYKAVVKINAKVKSSSRLRTIWSGSGTVISKDGLILTNAHVAEGDGIVSVDYLVIAFSEDPALGPEERYIARPLVVDEDLDLAVLVIDTDLNYRSVNRESLNLPFVPLGDSDQVNLGDPVSIIGYPAIGGNTITLTNGEVGGFTAERKYGSRAYIKTAATITGGTSGGLAMDRFGAIIGVPTQLGYGLQDELVDCRILVDTNGDGNINQRDMCVPLGGFINSMRPINLAKPLIEQALIELGKPTNTPTP